MYVIVINTFKFETVVEYADWVITIINSNNGLRSFRAHLLRNWFSEGLFFFQNQTTSIKPSLSVNCAKLLKSCFINPDVYT